MKSSFACPTCGHVPAAKRSKTTGPVDAIDLTTLDDAGLRAYRTRTAPYADVQFFLECRAGLSSALIAAAGELAAHVDATGRLSGLSRADFYRQYFALSAKRRIERDAIAWARYARESALETKAAAWLDARDRDTAIVDDYAQAA